MGFFFGAGMGYGSGYDLPDAPPSLPEGWDCYGVAARVCLYEPVPRSIRRGSATKNLNGSNYFEFTAKAQRRKEREELQKDKNAICSLEGAKKGKKALKRFVSG